MLEAAEQSGAQAIHPGYGFLSENADFARAVADAGLVWIGPSPEAIEAMGDKVAARNLVGDAGVPVAPGTREPVADVEAALVAAAGHRLPAHGQGRGRRRRHRHERRPRRRGAGDRVRDRAVARRAVLRQPLDPARALRHERPARRGADPRPVDGRVVALGERDCSVQRRHQKVAEETPCPVLTPPLRARMFEAAVRAGEAVGYRGAGTVEFLLDPASLASEASSSSSR